MPVLGTKGGELDLLLKQGSTPLTGGHPGLSLYPAGTATNAVISSWSDNSAAVL